MVDVFSPKPSEAQEILTNEMMKDEIQTTIELIEGLGLVDEETRD